MCDTRYLSSAVDLSALQPASEAFRSFLSRCFIRETDAGEGVNRQEAPGVNPAGGEDKLRLILFTGAPRAYVILKHTHRATKAQHYELYALPAPRGSGLKSEAVFNESSLPAGVKRAFAAVCVEAPAAWKTAV